DSSSFWFRVALSWLIPFAILATAIYKKEKVASNYLFAILLMTIVGEILGRELFYSSIVALQVGLF
ncbi:MAG: DMSO reductase, partial [Bacillota bacterium]|nr:DMSO reductase [Bacillota bacterium]